MFVDVEVDNLSALMPEHKEHVQDVKRRGPDGEEVDGYQVVDMIVQKSSPRLRQRLGTMDHVLLLMSPRKPGSRASVNRRESVVHPTNGFHGPSLK